MGKADIRWRVGDGCLAESDVGIWRFRVDREGELFSLHVQLGHSKLLVSNFADMDSAMKGAKEYLSKLAYHIDRIKDFLN